jgi:hypothetical protein
MLPCTAMQDICSAGDPRYAIPGKDWTAAQQVISRSKTATMDVFKRERIGLLEVAKERVTMTGRREEAAGAECSS